MIFCWFGICVIVVVFFLFGVDIPLSMFVCCYIFLFQTGCSNRELKILTIVKSSSGPTLTPVCFSNCNVSANDIFPNVKYKYNGRELTVIRTEVSVYMQ